MSENTFTMMYILTILVVGIIAVAPVIIAVCLILYISRKNRMQNRKIQQQAMERQKEKERLMQEEINLKKRKYMRVRCPYCGLLHPLTQTECSGCGAPLQADKNTGKINREEGGLFL